MPADTPETKAPETKAPESKAEGQGKVIKLLVEINKVMRQKDYEAKPGAKCHNACYCMATPVGYRNKLKFNGFADSAPAEGDLVWVTGESTREKYQYNGKDYEMTVLQNAHAFHVAPEQAEAEKATVLAKIEAKRQARAQAKQETPPEVVKQAEATPAAPEVEEENSPCPF